MATAGKAIVSGFFIIDGFVVKSVHVHVDLTVGGIPDLWILARVRVGFRAFNIAPVVNCAGSILVG